MSHICRALRRPALATLCGILLAGTAGARAEEADCTGYGALADNPEIALGRVSDGVPRAFFVRNGSDAKACPSTAERCRDKSFLVPGDRVLVSTTRGAFVCVDYLGAKGGDRAGWLPANGVQREPAPAVSLADWAGTWLQTEATVTIKPAKAGSLAIKGDATFGALEPDRVKRGAINVGAIEGITTPDGARLSFAMGDQATLPVDRGDAFACKVWMRRLGPYLLVDDNRQCGGANVSFAGIYRRKP